MADPIATPLPNPDDRQRSAVILVLFVLAFVLLIMIGLNPKLLESTPFMMVVTVILREGVVTVAMYLFGGTKTGGEVMRAQAAAVIASGPVHEASQ